MNDLTTTQNSKPVRPISPDMSEALTLRLDSTATLTDAAELIASDPVLLAEVAAALPALKAVAELRAGTEGVKAVVGRRFAVYPQPPRTDGEAAAWWADYFDVLADVPLASLEAGMRAYVADPASEFMPKPGRLKELAFTTASRSLTRYYRAKKAVELADEPKAIAGPRVRPEEVTAILSDFKAKTMPQRAKPTFKATPVELDAGGLSPRMRELMERRG
jgi:hypothetical protein